ncbi:HMG box domain-containing protein [Pleurotus pulmonarius]
MPKIQAGASKAKSATKATTTKPAKQEVKEKREPSAYNVFIKTEMATWRQANPGKKVTEAMKELGAMWRDHPSNPNRGKAPKSKSKTTSAKGKENLPSVLPDSDDTVPSSDD